METPERIAHLTQLVAGLCANRKYFDFDEDGCPQAKTIDMGKDWKQEGGWQRAQTIIVTDAVDLLQEIEKAARTLD